MFRKLGDQVPDQTIWSQRANNLCKYHLKLESWNLNTGEVGKTRERDKADPIGIRKDNRSENRNSENLNDKVI